MTDIVVSTADELEDAIEDATGGETIIIRAGSYGTIEIEESYASMVTLQAETPGTVFFDRIDIRNSANLHLDALQTKIVDAEDSRHVTMTDSVVTSGAFFDHVAHLLLTDNDIDGSYHALVLNDVQHFDVSNNYIHHAQSDLLRMTGDTSYGLVEDNHFRDTAGQKSNGDHADLIQFFGYGGHTPHDIVIRGNYLYDDPATGDVPGQGIFMSDPQSGGYKDILIEQNLISVVSVNSIYINGATENVVVRHNTLMPNAGDSGGIIRLAEKSGAGNAGAEVYGNVVKAISDETRNSDLYDNYIYGYGADLGALFSGASTSWEGFVPVDGSPIDYGSPYGAQNRLRELSFEEASPRREIIDGTEFDDQITGDADGERILGFTGNDAIYSNGGNDILAGQRNDDRLFGGAGSDVILGGGGRDVVHGGAGDDFFRIVQAQGGPHIEVIADFTSGEDIIQLKGTRFALTGETLDPDFFVLGEVALDADDRILYDIENGRGYLRYDPDGAGGRDARVVAILRDAPELSHLDFDIY